MRRAALFGRIKLYEKLRKNTTWDRDQAIIQITRFYGSVSLIYDLNYVKEKWTHCIPYLFGNIELSTRIESNFFSHITYVIKIFRNQGKCLVTNVLYMTYHVYGTRTESILNIVERIFWFVETFPPPLFSRTKQ